MKTMIALLALLLLLIGTGAARAENGQTVDLATALRAALAARPAAEAARQQAQAAQAAVGEARGGYLPQLSFSETFSATDEPAGSLFMTLNQQRLVLYPDAGPYNDPGTTRDYQTRFSLRQALFDPDVGYGLKKARKGAAAARATARWSAEQAVFDAFGAYLRVQQAAAARDWVESSLQEAREVVRLARERESAGVGLHADTLRARVRLAEAERHRLSAANDLRLAKRRLALAMGRDGGEIGIARPLTADDVATGRDLAPVPRADLRAARLQADAATLERRQAKARYLPRLGLQADYTWHDHQAPLGTEADSWQAGVGLHWDLFDGLRRERHIERTAAQARAARLQAEELRRGIDLQRQEARLRAEEAQLQLASARQARAEAEESHRLLMERYRAGLTDLSDLLAAQAALDRARYDAVAAESRMLLTRGNLRLQQGIFLQSMLPEQEDQQ